MRIPHINLSSLNSSIGKIKQEFPTFLQWNVWDHNDSSWLELKLQKS